MVGDSTNIEDSFKEGLMQEHLGFTLHGHKLIGEFALLKLKEKQGNAWLLIKKNDQFAIDNEILRQDKSVFQIFFWKI